MNNPSFTRISTRVASLHYRIGLNRRKKMRISEPSYICGKKIEEKNCFTPALIEGTEAAGSTSKEADLKEFGNGPNFMDDGDNAYIVLLNVFKYLSIKDLLSAARVAKVWNVVASDNSLWKTVSMKNHAVSDCNSLAKSLQKHGTEILDVSRIFVNRKKLCIALISVKTLRKIVFGYLPSDVLLTFAKNATQLTSLIASVINPEFHFEQLSKLKNLTELKLSGRMLCRYKEDFHMTLVKDWMKDNEKYQI